MTQFEQQFRNQLDLLAPDAEQSKFLLTVSGGKDSTALTHLFAAARLNFEIAHCNFHLRGTDSDGDEHFVANLANTLGKKLHIKHFDTFTAQKECDGSIEMVARQLRYDWFNELDTQFDFIVTAHTANDNAETLLLNLCRGTGLKGLTGIPPKNGKIIRPLLAFSTQDILQYLESQNLAYRTDRTNFSEEYQRNKVRLSVMPELQKVNPQILSTLCQNIAHFSQQFSFYSNEIERIKEEVTFTKDDVFYISLKKVFPFADAKLLLYEFLKPYGFLSEQCERIHQNMSQQSGKIFLSPTHILLKDREFLMVKRRDENSVDEIVCESLEDLADAGFTVTLMERTPQLHFESDANTIYIDAEKFHFPIEVRGWREGDWFCPFGMTGKQKLSDFFNNNKVNRFQKTQIPLLCTDNQIVWVVGMRADNRYRVTESTTHFYKIVYHGNLRQF